MGNRKSNIRNRKFLPKKKEEGYFVRRIAVTLSIFNFSPGFFAQIVENRRGVFLDHFTTTAVLNLPLNLVLYIPWRRLTLSHATPPARINSRDLLNLVMQ